MVSCLIFVYGSLMRGRANHRHLAAARFVRPAQTEPLYSLLDLGPYPALLPGGATAVQGELYEVNAETLAEVDAFEDHPHLYERRPVQLQAGVAAEAYFLTAPAEHKSRPLPGGRW